MLRNGKVVIVEVSPRNSRSAPTVARRSPCLKSHWPVTAQVPFAARLAGCNMMPTKVSKMMAAARGLIACQKLPPHVSEPRFITSLRLLALVLGIVIHFDVDGSSSQQT